MSRIYRLYEPLLARALNHRLLVLGTAVLLLAAAVFLFGRMGGEFIPQLDEGDFAVDTRTLTGSSLSETVDATLKAERILLRQFPEVEQVVAKIGSGEIPTDPMPIEAADQMVILKPKEQWTSATTRDELMAKMATALAVIPGVTFGFQQPVQMRFNELMTGARQDVVLKIYGDDLAQLERLAARVGGLTRGIEGVKDLYVEQVAGLDQILVRLDREQVAKYGLSIADINRTLNTAFAGQSAGLVFEGERRYPAVVRLAADKRQSLDDIRNLYITTPAGQQLPLSQVAQVILEQAPNQIQRDNTHRRITVGFNVRGRDVESVVSELQQKIGQTVRFPAGYSVTYGGQFQNLVQARERLSIAVPLALALIFVLLFFTFGSIRQSALIFMAIPLAAIGGVFALLVRGMPFSISAGVGFIALFGVAVLNGIVLIAEFNRLRHEEGLTDLAEIVRRGTEVRLRPVVMTALVASFGFLPMALSGSAGAEVQKPLATVVIGGLITATLLTLFVLPLLYTLTERRAVAAEARQAGTKAGLIPKMLLMLVLASPAARAQTAANGPLTLEAALRLADQQAPRLQLGNLVVSQQQALRRTAYDPGRFSATALLGQYNSRRFDNNLTISQSIPNPVLMRRLAELNDRNVASRQAEVAVTRNELHFQVRAAYYELRYLNQQRNLLRQQDTLLTQFVKAATVRLRTGETSSLERATAESQLADTRVRLTQNEARMTSAASQLQTLLFSPTPVVLPDEPLTRLALVVPADSQLARNPVLAQWQQQIKLAEQTRLVEQARQKPDFTAGFFSQTLIGNQLIGGQEHYFGPGYRFNGVQLGVSWPLLGGAQRARVQAARLGEQLAQTQLAIEQFSLERELAQTIRQYNQFRQVLDTYEQTALPQAALIQENARRAFANGDIGYVEFSLALQQALTIRANHLDLINQYNQAVLSVNYLIGNL